jgi:hypothetical protein
VGEASDYRPATTARFTVLVFKPRYLPFVYFDRSGDAITAIGASIIAIAAGGFNSFAETCRGDRLT